MNDFQDNNMNEIQKKIGNKTKLEKIKNKIKEKIQNYPNEIVFVSSAAIAIAIYAYSMKKEKKFSATLTNYQKEKLPQSVYSFLGSPLHLVLADRVAEGYNHTVDAFIQAQLDHEKRTGQKWNEKNPLRMPNNKNDLDAYNRVAKVINLLIKINGGDLDIPEGQCVSDYLERI